MYIKQFKRKAFFDFDVAGMVQHLTGGSGQFPASHSGVMGLMSQPRSASAFSGQRFPSPQSQQVQ